MPPDYSGENLRGCSFKGQDLSGANFSGADIRGANFSNANLRDANFSGVFGGLPRKWLITLILLSHSLTILSTLSSISIITIIRSHTSNIFFEKNIIFITVCMTIFFASIVTAAKQYFLKKLIFITVIILFFCGIFLAISHNILLLFERDIVFVSVAIAGCLTVSTTLIITIAFSIVLIKILSEKYYYIVIFYAFVAGFSGTIVRIALRAEETEKFISLIVNPVWSWAQIDIVWGTIWSWTITFIGYYIGLLSFKEHDELTLIRKIAIALSSIGSTNYYQADLQNANFEKAIIKNTDFRCGNLKGTWWSQAKQLHIARVGNSYLQYPLVRQLLTSGWGKNQNFDRLYLRGINLYGANLQDASFIGADLSEANLQDADLSRVIFKQTHTISL